MAALRLSERDLDHLQAAQEALLSPLEGSDPTEWQLRANQTVRRFVAADHSVFSLPTAAAPAAVTEDTDPTFPEQFLEYCIGVEKGEHRFRDPVLQRSARTRRAGGTGAYHERMLYREEEAKRSPAYNELFLPAGLTHMIGLSTPMPVGEATQFFSFDEGDAEERSELALARLQLLIPAFAAGARIQQSFHGRRAVLASMLDRLPQALAVYSTGGTLLHRSSALRDLLLADTPSADELRTVSDAMAQFLAARWRTRRKTADRAQPADASRGVRTPGAEYRLTGSYLPPDLLGAEGILVLVERVHPVLPSAPHLCSRFGLTPRQAEVALLLAQGLTDAAIAERLHLSPHTARRYSERVLKRLGLHSRAGVALALLRDT